MIYLVGNPTRDVITIGRQSVAALGGTVLYAAVMLTRMGFEVAVVGKGDREHQQFLEQRGVNIEYFNPSCRAVEFENIYRPEGRVQRAIGGETIHLEEVPPAAFAARAILVGPVLQEISPDIISVARKGLLMLDAQGFLRQLTGDGAVVAAVPQNIRTAVAGCDLLKLDGNEARNLTARSNLEETLIDIHSLGIDLVTVTMGRKGVLLVAGDRLIRVAAPRIDARDPTGAGDVFSAAFLGRCLEHEEPSAAAAFAAAAASLSTRDFGPAAIPTLEEIRVHLKKCFIQRGYIYDPLFSRMVCT